MFFSDIVEWILLSFSKKSKISTTRSSWKKKFFSWETINIDERSFLQSVELSRARDSDRSTINCSLTLWSSSRACTALAKAKVTWQLCYKFGEAGGLSLCPFTRPTNTLPCAGSKFFSLYQIFPFSWTIPWENKSAASFRWIFIGKNMKKTGKRIQTPN